MLISTFRSNCYWDSNQLVFSNVTFLQSSISLLCLLIKYLRVFTLAKLVILDIKQSNWIIPLIFDHRNHSVDIGPSYRVKFHYHVHYPLHHVLFYLNIEMGSQEIHNRLRWWKLVLRILSSDRSFKMFIYSISFVTIMLLNSCQSYCNDDAIDCWRHSRRNISIWLTWNRGLVCGILFCDWGKR